MEVFKLDAQPRTTTGKVLAKRMRKEGLGPAVIYGHGDNVMCTLNEKDLKPLLITPKVYLVDLMLGGKVEHVVLKEVQYHPVSDRPIHIDFYRYDAADPIVMAIPVALEGYAKGVRAGGKLVGGVRKLRVQGLVSDLPDVLPVDITELNVGETLMVSDVKFDNLEVVDTKTLVVATIKSQRGGAAQEEEAEPKEEKKAE